MNRIALIIPYLNRAEWLPDMLDSLLAQTEMPYETILVDNGSEDNSRSIVDRYAISIREKGCKVKCLTCIQPGAAAARNIGWRASESEYIYFFDSDDKLSPDFFAWANQKINGGHVVEMYVTISRMVLADGKHHIRRYGFSPRPCFQIISPYLTTQTMIIHRSLLERAGGWNDSLRFWDDWELGIRLLQSSPSVEYDSTHSWHSLYAHGDSITGDGHASRVEAIISTLKQVELLINNHLHPDPLESIALHYRIHIMAGNLIHESCPEGARRLLEQFRPSALQLPDRLVCNLLRLYTSHGGRGAWIIAWFILKLHSILHRK